jgi:hypothetical protein
MFNDVSTPKNEKNICMETFQERHKSSGEIAVVIHFFTSLLPFSVCSKHFHQLLAGANKTKSSIIVLASDASCMNK